jgi:two-component system response regulator AtoC
MKTRPRLLIVDDEPSITDAVTGILGDEGYCVEAAENLQKSQALMNCRQYDLVITDLVLPDGSGVNLLDAIKAQTPETEVILMTGHGSIDLAIDAIKRGAFYYIEKPFMPDQMIALTRRAIEHALMRQANKALRRAVINQSYGMIGRSPKMLPIYQAISATADSDASVLIEGESGTGKELIATAFHVSGGRPGGPFVHINCAAIPSELIESELFGFKRGAFTGADRDKRGLIEAASGGTLLLDEITEMPQHLQAKLLRVLQERKLRRLGEEREIEVDFRLVSATNRDTGHAMKEGQLREDLYFRIGTVRIKVPPLRERLDDLPLLAEHFLGTYTAKYRKNSLRLSDRAVEALSRYDWPGNVRELESVMERAVLFCPGDEITPENLPDELGSRRLPKPRYEIPPFLTLEEIEREAIAQTLERTVGNVKKAAQILRVHRPTFYRKLKRFGLLTADKSDPHS